MVATEQTMACTKWPQQAANLHARNQQDAEGTNKRRRHKSTCRARKALSNTTPEQQQGFGGLTAQDQQKNLLGIQRQTRAIVGLLSEDQVRWASLRLSRAQDTADDRLITRMQSLEGILSDSRHPSARDLTS